MALYGIERLNRLKDSIVNMPVENFMADITQENKDFIEDKNTESLEQGLDSDGNLITPEYSPFTVAYKKSIGATFDVVTLKDKGDFHKSITAEVKPYGFEMVANDNKWGKLVEKYGEAIVGISKVDVEELRGEVYLPNLIFKVKDYFRQLNG